MGQWADGSTDVIDTTPQDIRGLRSGVVNYLSGMPQGSAIPGANGGYSGPLNPDGTPTTRNSPAGNPRSRPSPGTPGYDTRNGAGVPGGGTSVVGTNPIGRMPEDPLGSSPTFDPIAGGFTVGGGPTDARPRNLMGEPGIQPVSRAPQVTWEPDGGYPPVVPGTPGDGGPGGGDGGGPGGPVTPPMHPSYYNNSGQGAPGSNPMGYPTSPYDRIQGMAAPNTPIPGTDTVRSVTDQPGASDVWNMLMQRMGPNAGVNLGAAPQAGGPSNIQTVDQLGSSTSGFFNNMMSQYQPAFTQGRTDALAQAREGMGNLTGSGAGNSLGTAMNRSLGNEQATLAELAKWGIGQELGRQTGLAQMNTDTGIANAGFQNNRDIAGTQTNQSQYNTTLNGLQSLLDYNQRGQTTNANNDLGLQDLIGRIGMANTGQGNAMSGSNASNFLQLLLSMSGGGVGNAVQSNPSILGSIFNTAGQIGGSYAGAH